MNLPGPKLLVIVCFSVAIAIAELSTNANAAEVSQYFGTLASHMNLPSGNVCAHEIPATPETVPTNVPFNRTVPSVSQLVQFYNNPGGAPPASDFFRVDGNYTGSTEMILRWAACKWGVDEDAIRAQAWNENQWRQGSIDDPAMGGGDRRFNIRECVQGNFTALWNFACPQCCYQSWGILQTKVFYEWHTWPMIKDSTAFNADYRLADQRACMNGDYGRYFANPIQQPNSYSEDIAAGDLDHLLWGCIGKHYSGSWYDPAAIKYISHVKGYLLTRPWEHLQPSRSSLPVSGGGP